MAQTMVFKPSRKPSRRSDRFKALGKILHIEINSAMDLIHASDSGLSLAVIDELRKHGFKVSDLDWAINPRTLSHRKKSGSKLTASESQRVIRAAKIQTLAESIFGEEEKAVRWMGKPRKVFDGQSAKAMLRTEEGAHLVEETLIGLDEGFFA